MCVLTPFSSFNSLVFLGLLFFVLYSVYYSVRSCIAYFRQGHPKAVSVEYLFGEANIA